MEAAAKEASAINYAPRCILIAQFRVAQAARLLAMAARHRELGKD
jgi:hypothetical protein